MAKKVKIGKKDEDGMDSWWCMFYKCPACGKNNVAYSFNYCPDCGRKLDWKKRGYV